MRYFYSNARDPISSFTHYLGMCCATLGSLLLVWRAIRLQSSTGILVSVIIFGVSLILLYSASTLYHFYRGEGRRLLFLRKLDHATIYLLIAGTYTPIAIHVMAGSGAKIFLTVIWAAAVLGVIVMLCWFNAPRPLYTGLYLLLGWAVVFAWPAFSAMEAGCMTLVATGGICYSIGAVFYMLKRPVISENFGFHEIFHLFVLAGSLFHYLAVLLFVLK